MTTYTDKQQCKSSERPCYFPVLTLVFCCSYLLNQKCTRADGWSAELPTAPSQSQLLTPFHHCFAFLLFQHLHGADGARKGPVGPASTLQHNPLGWFPLQMQLPHPACPTSSPWGDGTSSEEQGDCTASTLHNTFP